MKLAKPAFVVEATVKLGYPETVIIALGILDFEFDTGCGNSASGAKRAK
jgi:hypothetical protein